MFKQRLLTTLILAPLVLFLIFYATEWVFGEVILLLVLVAGWEWSGLIPIHHRAMKMAFIVLLLMMAWLSYYLFYYWLAAGLLVWGGILVALIQFPRSQSIWGYPWVVACFCFLLLPLFAHSMMAIYRQEQGRALLVYLLFLVWAADIGAYLIGKQWGRHKLIPLVSPGKSIEGVLGGFTLALFMTLGAYYYFQPQISFVSWLIIAIATTLISIIGDLFFSMLKRRVKLKDTGHLIPGHGGLLDRIDSLIAAAPLFYWGFLTPGL